METKRKKLYLFVEKAHKGQARKYTGEDYFTSHILEVVDLSKHLHELAFEIALCHDLVEDREVTLEQLYDECLECGYSEEEASFIKLQVFYLTKEFSSKKYPHLNRKKRSHLEALRAKEFSDLAITIKHNDIYSNCKNIASLDAKFADVYLKEKESFLMTNGIGQDLTCFFRALLVIQIQKTLLEKGDSFDQSAKFWGFKKQNYEGWSEYLDSEGNALSYVEQERLEAFAHGYQQCIKQFKNIKL